VALYHRARHANCAANAVTICAAAISPRVYPFGALPALLRCDKTSQDQLKRESSMGTTRVRDERPLSPHLQIYKPMLSMIMSVFHRMTGAALYLGAFVLIWWLSAAATGPGYFNFVSSVLGSVPGRLTLFALTWALIHHMLGGVRHFVWDTVHGFALPNIELLVRLTILGSLSITVLLWVIGYMAMGAL
jgi:succinate dehydrogenase / fumarate reductase cytochrome b subunit